jgi:hypothetical protein
MKRFVSFAIFASFFFWSPAKAQTIDELKKCIVFVFGRIHIPSQNGHPPTTIEMPLGTAFFVLYPDKRGGDDYGFNYLVTAKHVLKDTDGTYLKSVKLRLNLITPENGSSFAFGDVPVIDENSKSLWFEDKEDQQNDVAILPLLPDQKKAEFKSVPLQMFTDIDLLRQQNVAEGDSVYLVGLMPQYYGEKKNYPVVRRGNLALLTDEAIQTGPDTRQHAYLAELASWPGNSGAPVFLNLSGIRNGVIMGGSNFHLLGLMLGYFSNIRRGETVDTHTVVGGDPLNIGISFILPASTIRKVLDSAPAQQRRDLEINALKTR